MISSLLFKITTLAAFNTGACNPNRDNPNNLFFGFPHWWQYIQTGRYDGLGNCTPEVNFPSGIWAIALAVLDMLLYVAGIVAVVIIIIAGINYLTAGGIPDKAAAARRRIYNALIGLGIVLIAGGLVSFIGNRLGG